MNLRPVRRIKNMTTIKRKNLPDELIRSETFAERARLSNRLAELTPDQ